MAINRIKVSRAAEKLVRQNRLDAAIKEYRKLLDDSPDDLATLNKVGDLHRRSGQTQRALTCFQKIAEHYRDHGFVQKAIAMFKKIAKLDAGNPEALEQLVALYSEQGFEREALRHLRQAAQLAAETGESERALELEYRALELCPEDPAAQRGVARRLRDAGEVERCIASYLRAASGYASKRQLDEAVVCCHEALSVAPLDPGPAESLCRLLLAASESERAVQEIDALLEADPDTPHLLVLQGEALLSAGEPARARQMLDRARGSAAAEGNINFHVARVRVDLAQGKGDDAVGALETVVPLLVENQRHDAARRLLCDVLQIEAGNATALRLLLDVCQGATNTSDGDGAWALLDEQLPGSELAHELPALRNRLDAAQAAQAATPAPPAEPAGVATVSADAPGHSADEGAGLATGTGVSEPDDDGPVDEEFVAEHLTEADVFIKYKLLPKAAAHLKRIVDRYPLLIVAHQRLVSLYEELGEPREVVYHAAALVHAHHRRGAKEEARAALRMALGHLPANASLQAMRSALRQGGALPPFVQDTVRREPVPEPPSTPAVSPAPAAAPGVAEESLSGPVEPSPVPPARGGLDTNDDNGEPSRREVNDNPVAAGRAPGTPGVAITSSFDEEIVDLLDEPDPGPGGPPVQAELPVEETAPVAGTVSSDGGFFDLAGALEEDLAREEAEQSSSVTEDGREAEDPASGIRRAIQEQVGEDDHQTHYQLGIAFKEMGMLDEAIGEFQQASRDPEHFPSCCSMLGLCFREKGMSKIAEKWYRRGLDHLGAAQGSDQQLGLVYDLAELHLERGEVDTAREGFTEVFATNANYREVAARLRQVAERSPGTGTAGPLTS